MTRRAFFSFHYKNDVWRANQVRNSWVTQGKEAAGFIDSAEFEKIKEKGDNAVEDWIDEQLKGTSVTVVLIGSETSNRKYVKYEVKESYKKGNGLLGVHIHKQKDENGDSIYFFQIAKTYDYVDDDGYNNLGDWIEKAAKDAGR